MNVFVKRIAFVLIMVILLSLCLTPMVFATEEPQKGTLTKTHMKTPSNAMEHEPAAVTSSNAALENAPPNPVTATSSNAPGNVLPGPDFAATADELLEWLEGHENIGGTLKLTADIFLDDLIYMNNSDEKVTIETGEFSITAVGMVYFWRSGLTVRGRGGEKGVLRAAEGGALSAGYMTVLAEEGYAVYQEEGGGLVTVQCILDKNAVRYAETPFVWEWRNPAAVVEPGQTEADVLPETVMSYNVNRYGQMSTEKVPVIWDLAEHEDSRKQRLRFEAVGSTPGFACFSRPVCTVAYNDFPLTFTWIEASETASRYTIEGDFTKPEGRLPIDVTMEYSFDGENWRPHMTDSVDEDSVFRFSIRKGKGEDRWDADENPWFWFRVHWDDAGTHYYSNILRFSGSHFDKAEDHGGNRGGGTDIIVPPEPPESDPPSESPSPEPDEPSKPSSPEPPESNLPSESPSPEPDEPSRPSSPGPDDPSKPSLPGLPESLSSEPDDPSKPSSPELPPLPGSPSPEPDEPSKLSSLGPPESDLSPESLSLKPDELSKPEVSAPGQPADDAADDDADQETVKSPDSIPASAEGTSEMTFSDEQPAALHIVTGLAAIAASIGGAAFYLHPEAWKRFLRKLRNIMKR